MYRIKAIYDTGDSFHQERDREHIVEEIVWEKLDKAKQALKDIKAHNDWYLVNHKRWNVDKKEKEAANKKAEKQAWYSKEYPDFQIGVEDDKGNRVKILSCWNGYFENLNGAEIVASEDEEISFRY